MEGALQVRDGEAHLSPTPVPNGFGLFFYGPNQVQIIFGDCFRCVGGMTQRLSPVVMTNAGGSLSRQIDLTSFGASMIVPDTTWNFQFWFRDPMGPGGSGFNLSDGISITFCP